MIYGDDMRIFWMIYGDDMRLFTSFIIAFVYCRMSEKILFLLIFFVANEIFDLLVGVHILSGGSQRRFDI